LRLLIITSCTGEKSVTHKRALTLEDFRKGPEHVARRERELQDLLTPAEDLYTGQQHVRLMRGVRALQEAQPDGGPVELSLWILSAGYGFVPGSQKLAPYEATFQGMKSKELRNWADKLQIPRDFRRIVSEAYDLGLILLGDSYLTACALDPSVVVGGATILLCGERTATKLTATRNLTLVSVGNREAARFSCGLVGLKGEIARRLLSRIAIDPSLAVELKDPHRDVLEIASGGPKLEHSVHRGARAQPSADYVIRLPASWWLKPHRKRLSYFIPDWDDLVDPDYDFAADRHSGGKPDWSNEVYAHQLYDEPNYDGILVSKIVAEGKAKKREQINRLGVHRYLRVPPEFPVMGDCGAFGYLSNESPPFLTSEILDYYTRLGFNLGVSIDHLIVAATMAQRKHRYEITLQNAEDFLREHRSRRLRWEPIGAIQGWSPETYAGAARLTVAMGYRYLGIGGLVRSPTKEVLNTLASVRAVVPESVSIHLFGIARPSALHAFAELGVRSVDSASFLRRAWLGARDNYQTPDGAYCAIRIPEVGRSFRAKRMLSEGRATQSSAVSLERECLRSVRAFDRGDASLGSTLDTLLEYDALISPDRIQRSEDLRRTLADRPWQNCSCHICRRLGVEVVIFRGNNRNRRRGFHNTYVFYRVLSKLLQEPEEPDACGGRRGQLALWAHRPGQEAEGG
jgi:hypothetical protein